MTSWVSPKDVPLWIRPSALLIGSCGDVLRTSWRLLRTSLGRPRDVILPSWKLVWHKCCLRHFRSDWGKWKICVDNRSQKSFLIITIMVHEVEKLTKMSVRQKKIKRCYIIRQTKGEDGRDMCKCMYFIAIT